MIFAPCAVLGLKVIRDHGDAAGMGSGTTILSGLELPG